MLTFTDMQNMFQKGARDTSTESLTFGKEQMNIGLHIAEAELKVLERDRSRNASTTASDQTVEKPENVIRLKKVYVTISNVRYVGKEVYDEWTWQKLNAQNANQTSDYLQYYIDRGNYIEVFPKPANTQTLTFVYTGGGEELVHDDYTTGTASITNGLKALTGSGTTWTSDFVNRFVKFDTASTWYEISAFTSTTALTVRKAYQGVTVSDGSYVIGQVPRTLPPALHNLPPLYALWQYYQFIRKDELLAKMYENQWNTLLKWGKGTFANKYNSAVIPSQNRLRRGLDVYWSALYPESIG